MEKKERPTISAKDINLDEAIEKITTFTEEEIEPKKKEPKKQKKVEVKKIPLDMSWLDCFKANYAGETEEAKEIEEYLKETYKGNNYVPWATMERLTYMQDPEAKFTNVLNDNGGLVHTSSIVMEQSNEQKDILVSKTTAPMYCHTVKVALEFKGKMFIEDYPIQDTDYSPAKIFNQNLVNKALKRARAKVASMATGIGLKLYEGQDLQFENDEKPKNQDEKIKKPEITKEKVEEKPVAKSTTKATAIKPVTKAVETIKATDSVVKKPKKEIIEDVSEDDAETKKIDEVIKILRENDEESVIIALQRVNVAILSKYKFTLTLEDTDDELRTKLKEFPDVEKFGKTLINLIG